MAYNASLRLLGWFLWHFNCKAMPTNDTNYSCHITATELFKPIIWVHIMPHHATIITRLGGKHTHTHTHTHKHTHTQTHTHTHTHTQTHIQTSSQKQA